MTYVTGQPIIFVGCGQVRVSIQLPHTKKAVSLTMWILIQFLYEIFFSLDIYGTYQLARFDHFVFQTYTDLRQLRVANVVQAILSE
jgi:hypothetical protein